VDFAGLDFEGEAADDFGAGDVGVQAVDDKGVHELEIGTGWRDCADWLAQAPHWPRKETS
jgi:hypothetical protein